MADEKDKNEPMIYEVTSEDDTGPRTTPSSCQRLVAESPVSQVQSAVQAGSAHDVGNADSGITLMEIFILISPNFNLCPFSASTLIIFITS